MAKSIEVIQKTREYLDYVERHILNVRRAWEELNTKCQGKGFVWISDDIIWFQINGNVNSHDISKLSEKEFVQYRQFFYPTSFEDKNEDLMNEAWIHHLSNNAHHWQSWTKTGGDRTTESLISLIENICDWMAMGYEFGDNAKIYYENNKETIELPDWAEKHMYEIFDIIYPTN